MTVVVSTRRTELEEIIERGLDTFVEVGAALLEIRDSRLYRETHQTFEDYCHERWGFSRPRAYQFMQAAEVGAALSTNVDTAPASEAVARQLAPVLKTEGAEAVEEVWGAVVEEHGPTPTAEQVREIVEERRDVQELRDSEAPGPRKIGQQLRIVASLAEKARRIGELEQHIDLDAIAALPEEEKAEWKLQLSAARTVLSRVIGAL